MSEIRIPWLSPRRGLILLLPAAIALAFANGRWQVALVALIAPFLLRVFLLSQPILRGLVLGLFANVAAHLIMWIGIIPAPGWLYYAIAATYGLIFFLPFVIDRIIAPRLAGLASTLVLPLAWYITEILVYRLTPYGSWGAAGYTQADNLWLMQSAALIGIAGVGFVMTWFSSAVAWLVTSMSPRRIRVLRAALVFTISAAVLLGGATRLALRGQPGGSVRVAMLTPSIELTREFNQVLYAAVGSTQLDDLLLAQMRDLSRQLNDDLLSRSRTRAEAGAQIIVWSELAGRVFREDEDAWLGLGQILARETGVYLFMGLGTWWPDHQPPLENKMVAITPAGDVAWHYLKARPIVGAEAHLLPPAHDVVPTMDTPFGRLGAVICHDLDFPDLVRRAGRQDVDVLLAPAADWRVIESIHAHMAMPRAIENGCTLVRPTYAGLSVVVDPYGRLVTRVVDFDLEDRSIVASVPVYHLSTVYSAISGYLPWLAGLILIGLLVRSLMSKRP